MPRIAAALGVIFAVTFCIGFNIHRYPVVWESIAAPDPKANPHGSAGIALPLLSLSDPARKAVDVTAAEAKGLPQPIPLPQLSGVPQPIPAPGRAPSKAPAKTATGRSAGASQPGKHGDPATGEPSRRAQASGPKTAKPRQAAPEASAKSPDAKKPKGDSATKPKPPTDNTAGQHKDRAVAPMADVAKGASGRKAQPAARPQPITVERPLEPISESQLSAAGYTWPAPRGPNAPADSGHERVRRLPAVNPGQSPPPDPYLVRGDRIPLYPTTGK